MIYMFDMVYTTSVPQRAQGLLYTRVPVTPLRVCLIHPASQRFQSIIHGVGPSVTRYGVYRMGQARVGAPHGLAPRRPACEKVDKLVLVVRAIPNPS